MSRVVIPDAANKAAAAATARTSMPTTDIPVQKPPAGDLKRVIPGTMGGYTIDAGPWPSSGC